MKSHSVFLAVFLALFIMPMCYAAPSNSTEQDLKKFKQQINDDIAVLITQNANLQNQLQTITTRISTIEQQAVQLEALQATNQNLMENKLFIISPVYLSKLQRSPIGSFIFQYRFLIGAFVVLALPLVLYQSLFRKKQPKKTEAEDYNFLDNQDGGMAKLDLARTFSAIGDKEKARKLLAEVINHGAPSQRAEAEALLKQITI